MKPAVEAVVTKELYIVALANFRPLAGAQFAVINACVKGAESSPLLQDLALQKIPGFE